MTTAQEIFDRSVTRIIQQGRPSLKPRPHSAPMCAYRSPDGCVCAVGALIEDSEYTSEMDTPAVGPPYYGTGVKSLADRGLLPERLIGHTVLLFDLQQAHDEAGLVAENKTPNDFVERFADAAYRVASCHKLDTEALDTALHAALTARNA